MELDQFDILDKYEENAVLLVDKRRTGIFFKKYKLTIYEEHRMGWVSRRTEHNNYESMFELFQIDLNVFKSQIIKYNGKIDNNGFIFFKNKEDIDNFVEYLNSLIIIMKLNNC